MRKPRSLSGSFLITWGAAVCLAVVSPLWAQTSSSKPGPRQDLNRRVEQLEAEIKALKRHLVELQRQLNQVQRPAADGKPNPPIPPQLKGVVLDVSRSPALGSKAARLALVEFSDYQCPYCARHFRETLPQITKEYVDTGKLRYVFRDYPIAHVHPQATKAAEAAHCAGDQNRYWQMHSQIFSNQGALSVENLLKYATLIGLDVTAFQQCLEAGKYASRVQEQVEEGQKLRIRGTPTFYLGFLDSAGNLVTPARLIPGALPYSKFKETIDGLLFESPENPLSNPPSTLSPRSGQENQAEQPTSPRPN